MAFLTLLKSVMIHTGNIAGFIQENPNGLKSISSLESLENKSMKTGFFLSFFLFLRIIQHMFNKI